MLKSVLFFRTKNSPPDTISDGPFLFYYVLHSSDDLPHLGFQGFYFLNLCFIQGLVARRSRFFRQLRHIQVILCDPAGGYAAAAPSVMQRLSRPTYHTFDGSAVVSLVPFLIMFPLALMPTAYCGYCTSVSNSTCRCGPLVLAPVFPYTPSTSPRLTVCPAFTAIESRWNMRQASGVVFPSFRSTSGNTSTMAFPMRCAAVAPSMPQAITVPSPGL